MLGDSAFVRLLNVRMKAMLVSPSGKDGEVRQTVRVMQGLTERGTQRATQPVGVWRASMTATDAMFAASCGSASVVSRKAATTSTATSGANRLRLSANTFASFHSRAPR